MPAPRLESAKTKTSDASAALALIEPAVLAVLAGTSVTAAAATAGTTVEALTDAVYDYQAAGRTALHDRARDGRWHQANITFTDWTNAEDAASITLWPRLRDAEREGLISCWWYIRKAPTWRLRLHPGDHTTATELDQFITELLTDPATQQLIADWSPSRYEPETYAFGGAMHITHQLFHADSTHILAHLHRSQPAPSTPIGRRELSILLCSALLRGARQEWHEQGDVWWRVTQLRPQPRDASEQRISALSSSIRRLLLLDTTSTDITGPTGPLADADTWFAAMTNAGDALAEAARAGWLRRGLRDILAHHVIFHWNRLGLPATTQALLAHSAVHAVMHATSSEPLDHR